MTISLDPLGGVPEWRGTKRGASHAAIAAHDGETGTLQHPHVLRDRGEGHVEPPGELADRLLAGGEAREDLAPRRIGERAERAVEGALMVNHSV